MLPERLKPFATPQPILDHGYLLLVDVMGDEDAIVQAARVSYAAGPKKGKDDRNLLRYLMRARHTSPFEQVCIKLEVKLPIYVERQWARHRTASWNEVSGRYSVLPDECQKTPEDGWRTQATDNKQGSGGFVTDWPADLPSLTPPEDSQRRLALDAGDPATVKNFDHPGEYLSDREERLQAFAREVYDERLKFGVAKEQARCVLPVATYTSKVWTIDLHNLLHFLALRMDHHAQKEIRDYANAIAEIVKVWVPNVWEAFEDYRLKAMYLTRQEVEGLRAMLRNIPYEESTFDQWSDVLLPAMALHGAGFLAESHAGSYPKAEAALASVKSRESVEFRAKLARLLGK